MMHMMIYSLLRKTLRKEWSWMQSREAIYMCLIHHWIVIIRISLRLCNNKNEWVRMWRGRRRIIHRLSLSKYLPAKQVRMGMKMICLLLIQTLSSLIQTVSTRSLSATLREILIMPIRIMKLTWRWSLLQLRGMLLSPMPSQSKCRRWDRR